MDQSDLHWFSAEGSLVSVAAVACSMGDSLGEQEDNAGQIAKLWATLLTRYAVT